MENLDLTTFLEEPNSKNGVRRILTLDWLQRKTRKWPLLPVNLETQKRFCLKSMNEDEEDEDESVFITCRNRQDRNKYIDTEILTTKLYSLYPHLSLLFEKYQGKLAVCGGALTRIIYQRSRSDLDLFFYNCNEDEAAAILQDCLSILALHSSDTFRIEKKANVVNFICENDEGEKLCYQFVLRIYPSLDSIIGGFDLGSCMIAFDGETTYTTYLGAWCIYKKCNIVDTTRRSLSFDRRLIKYQDMGFAIVMPGLSTDLLKPITGKERDIKFTALRDFLRQNNLYVDTDNFRGEYRGLEQVFDVGSKTAEINDIVVNEYSIKKKRNEFLSRLNVISEKMLKQHSDYEYYYYDNIEATTGTMLRCNNLNGVIAYIRSSDFNNVDDVSEIRVEIENFLNTPKVIVPELSVFKEHLMQYGFAHVKKSTANRNTSKEISLFAEYVLDYRKKCSSNSKKLTALAKATQTADMHAFLENLSHILHDRMVTNAKICEENMKGVKFITENPGRQWTSSLNPIMEDPRKFYKNHYVSFTIGLNPQVETTLRCMRKYGSVWSCLPKDIFNLILFTLTANTI
jgi:hypothetical protein